jgi:hypothetical protein
MGAGDDADVRGIEELDTVPAVTLANESMAPSLPRRVVLHAVVRSHLVAGRPASALGPYGRVRRAWQRISSPRAISGVVEGGRRIG